MALNPDAFKTSILILNPPKSANPPEPPEPTAWWALEYWRSCAICRIAGPPRGILDDMALARLTSDFRELIESGAVDRIVIDLSMLAPCSRAIVHGVSRMIYRANDLGCLIALAAADEPTCLELMHTHRLTDLAPVLPGVLEATALLQSLPIPDRVPSPL